MFGGLWLFSIGLRMVTQFIIDANAIMLPPIPFGDTWATWDFWFDWFPMIPLGAFILWFGFKELRKEFKQQKQQI